MVKYEEIKDILSNNSKKAVDKFVKNYEDELNRSKRSMVVFYNRMVKEPKNEVVAQKAAQAAGYYKFLDQWYEMVKTHQFELNNTIEDYEPEEIYKALGLE